MAQDFDADAMLAFFGQLGKEVDNLKVKITSLNEQGGKGTSNLTNEFARFGQTVQRYTTGPIKAMDAAVAGLAKTLAGAGGLALSFAGAAKALDAFAVGELRIKNFATNTGFTVENVKNLRVQLAAAGIDAGEAASGIGSIGSKLQEVLALQETSSFYRSLQASSPALAEQVRQLMNAGKQQEALNVLQQAYNNGGERFKAWLPTVTGYSRAMYEAGKVGMKGLIEPWKFNDDQAREYHKTMTNLETISNSVWTSMAYTMIESLNKMIGGEAGMKKLNEQAKEFAAGFKSFFDTYVLKTLTTTKEEFGWVVKAFSSVDEFINKWTERGEGDKGGDAVGRVATQLGSQRIGRWLGTLPPDPNASAADDKAVIDRMNAQKPGGAEGGKAGGLWDWIKKQFSMEAHAAGAEGSGPLLVQESVDTEKDSNAMLTDMRDMIQKWDAQGGGIVFRPGVTGGGGGLGPYGSTPGMTFRPGVRGGGRHRGGGDDSASTGDGAVPGVDPGEGKEGSEYLAARRARYKEEVEKDPALKRDIAALMTLEHETDPAAVFESLINRTDYVNTEREKQGKRPLSLREMISSGFYGPYGQVPGRAAQLERQPGRLKRMYDAMAFVFGGSNLLEGATDQGSGSDPNVNWQGGRKVRFGEVYNDFGGGPGGHAAAARYREMIQRGFREGVKAGVWKGGVKAVPFANWSGAATDPTFEDRYGGWSRASVDNALRSGNTGTASVDIEFGDKKGDSVWEKGTSPFIDTKIHRSPQAPIAGGGVTAFNTYAFE